MRIKRFGEIGWNRLVSIITYQTENCYGRRCGRLSSFLYPAVSFMVCVAIIQTYTERISKNVTPNKKHITICNKTRHIIWIGWAYDRRQNTKTNQNGSKFENEKNTGHRIQNNSLYNNIASRLEAWNGINLSKLSLQDVLDYVPNLMKFFWNSNEKLSQRLHRMWFALIAFSQQLSPIIWLFFPRFFSFFPEINRKWKMIE